MATFLRKLLDAKEPLFSLSLRQLEQLTGYKSIDVGYIADITHRGHDVMRQIGLDTADTTPQELYRALNAQADNAQLFAASDDVALIFNDTEVISFNHEDVNENKSLPYEQRSLKHVRLQVQRGLMARYVAADGDDQRMIQELIAQAGINVQKLADEGETTTMQNDTTSQPSALFIGDIFTDAFIMLPEDSAKIIKEEDGKQWLALPFGQKPAYDHVDIVRSVGPSPNAAVSTSRLGLNSSLMAWIGGDDTGREALKHLAEEHVGVDSMVTEPENKTSYWYVLRYGTDRTMLVRSEKYKYEWKDPATAPDWVYLSYIGENSWPLHEALLEYLGRNPEVKLAFQPGTFHFKWGVDKLRAIYGHAEMIVMNREEAVDVTGKDYNSLRDLANGLHELGPRYVVITDGPNGSYASYDAKLVTIPNYPDPAPPLDRTGAGDAFASTIVAALALGETMETALTWAPINSMSVVQQLGAQAGLLKLDELKGYLESAPEEYKVKDVE